MEFINIEEITKQKKIKYEEIYDKILKQTLSLLNKIMNKKNIYLEISMDKIDFDEIEYILKRETIYFESVLMLIGSLKKWNKKGKTKETKKQKIIKYANLYNSSLIELNHYIKIETDIIEYGYNIIEKNNIDKLIKLFKEMLKYKNKEYNSNSFKDLLDFIDISYHYYHKELQKLSDIIFNNEVSIDNINIKVNDIEKIISLEYLYNILTEEKNDYKNYAYYYKEFELNNGKSYKDLYNNLKDKLIKLFKEMLDYLNIDYDKNSNELEYFQVLMMNYYPYYIETLEYLDKIIYNPNQTYIELLNNLENIYNKFSKDFKSNKQLLEDYQKLVEIKK